MKKLFVDLLYIILIVSLIAFMIYTVIYLKSNGKECLKDPITYFEGKNEGVDCSCMKDGIEWPNKVKVEMSELRYDDINFSEVEIIK